MNEGIALIDSLQKTATGDINHHNRDSIPSQGATSTRILIGDENNAARAILRDLLLHPQDYADHQDYVLVGEATSWGNFLPMVKRLTPDIIYLDQDLPGADIPHFLKNLQTTNPEIMVIVMSSDRLARNGLVAAGAAGFLEKPFSQAKAIEELTRVDQTRRLLHEVKVQSTNTCTGVRIALADSSSDTRQLLKTILESMGAEIVGEAIDGQQAIDMAMQQQPDIICLDVEMPTMNGIDALARISAEHPDIKAVMVTSQADRNTVMRTISLGACGYLFKPYKSDQIETTLRKVVRYERKCA